MVTFPKSGMEPSGDPSPRDDAAPKMVQRIPMALRSHKPSAAEKCVQEGVCRMCRRPARDDLAQALADGEVGVRPLTRHHIVPQRMWKHVGTEWRGLRNARANVLPLCRPCHDLVESPDTGTRLMARAMLRRAMGQDEISFAIAAKGKPWFDKHYPIHWCSHCVEPGVCPTTAVPSGA